MRYFALACDYDGTIATHGAVDEHTLEAMRQLKDSGRKLILVTGRILDDLMQVFGQYAIFDRIVAENGALVYDPATHTEHLLGKRPTDEFMEALRRREVDPLTAGKCIVATHEPHAATVLSVIKDMGLELQIIFNKGSVMILPSGLNKATGLEYALEDLKLSPHNAVGVGDAENDHAFLKLCECSAAVGNALSSVKNQVDVVMEVSHGAGVAQLIEKIISTDLQEIDEKLQRRMIPLGYDGIEREVSMPAYGINVMLAGTSGGGKSTFATGLLERLAEQKYQFCIIDPEGDYEQFEGASVLGTGEKPPTAKEMMTVINKPTQNCVVNLVGVSRDHRPEYFDGLFTALMNERTQTGRPHWIVVDEAHHLLPGAWSPARIAIPQEMQSIVYITVHPDHVAHAVLASIDLLIVIGEAANESIAVFTKALGAKGPDMPSVELKQGEAIGWWVKKDPRAFWFKSIPPTTERHRHSRKYAEGELEPGRSFYFRGRDGKLNLRAQNLMLFLQLADGVDDETWNYHLHNGDYSRWFRENIKDEELAREAEEAEQEPDLSPAETRARIKESIEHRYTQPE